MPLNQNPQQVSIATGYVIAGWTEAEAWENKSARTGIINWNWAYDASYIIQLSI